MAKDLVRFTVYLPRDFIRAVRMEAVRRGTSASRLVQDSLLKDRMLRDVLPKIEGNGKERRAS
jgi:hypothetical protein